MLIAQPGWLSSHVPAPKMMCAGVLTVMTVVQGLALSGDSRGRREVAKARQGIPAAAVAVGRSKRSEADEGWISGRHVWNRHHARICDGPYTTAHILVSYCPPLSCVVAVCWPCAFRFRFVLLRTVVAKWTQNTSGFSSRNYMKVRRGMFRLWIVASVIRDRLSTSCFSFRWVKKIPYRSK